MTRRYVVGVNGLDAQKEVEFRKYLDTFGAGYWHWIDNFWLVIIHGDGISSKELSTKINELGTERNLVLEIHSEISWHGWGRPTAQGQNMFEWLKTVWVEEKNN